MSTSINCLAAGALLLAAGGLAQSSNPISVSSSKFVGFRNSSNTYTFRDLGFMGSIGDTYILSFGDGTPTNGRNGFNASAPVGSPGGACGYLSARDGGGLQGDDPLSYADTTVITVGGCGNSPEMGYLCPHISGEEDSQGLGITNVMALNSTTGCIWTRPEVSGANSSSAGAGLAVVTLDSSGNPTCTRPFGKSTWTGMEPDWGQLSALDGRDGYTYVFANGYNNGDVNSPNNNVVVARAATADVFDLGSYSYWNGTAFSSDRIYVSDLTATSPQNIAGLTGVGQGSAWWSTHYNKFVYMTNGQGGSSFNVYAWTADLPQGPYSDPVIIYTDDYPQVTTGPTGFDYGGYIMPKFTSSDGTSIYFAYTRGGFEFVINTVFK